MGIHQKTFYLAQASRCALAAENAKPASRKNELLAAEHAWRQLAEMSEKLSDRRSEAPAEENDHRRSEGR
jgi:hypothetical protein